MKPAHPIFLDPDVANAVVFGAIKQYMDALTALGRWRSALWIRVAASAVRKARIYATGPMAAAAIS